MKVLLNSTSTPYTNHYIYCFEVVSESGDRCISKQFAEEQWFSPFVSAENHSIPASDCSQT